MCIYNLYRTVMLLLAPYTKYIYIFKYIKPSKIKNLDKHGNKKLMVLIYCSVSY
jgi:hypothetical protein